MRIHKSSHHFGLAGWWIDDVPRRVYASGGLRFYGADNARDRGLGERPERSSTDSPLRDAFSLDLRADERMREVYLENEHHDGYLRGRDVVDEGITIEDGVRAVSSASRATPPSGRLPGHRGRPPQLGRRRDAAPMCGSGINLHYSDDELAAQARACPALGRCGREPAHDPPVQRPARRRSAAGRAAERRADRRHHPAPRDRRRGRRPRRPACPAPAARAQRSARPRPARHRGRRAGGGGRARRHRCARRAEPDDARRAGIAARGRRRPRCSPRSGRRRCPGSCGRSPTRRPPSRACRSNCARRIRSGCRAVSMASCAWPDGRRPRGRPPAHPPSKLSPLRASAEHPPPGNMLALTANQGRRIFALSTSLSAE